MRVEPTKNQMRRAAEQELEKISQVARSGHAVYGPGFVWLQFIFKGKWQLRMEYMAMDAVVKLGMRKDTMDQIGAIARAYDPLSQAATLMFKGDHLESMGIMPLVDPD